VLGHRDDGRGLGAQCATGLEVVEKRRHNEVAGCIGGSVRRSLA